MEIKELIEIIVGSLVLLQLIVMFFAFKAENERKKKQSTVEFINNIRDRYKPTYNELNKKYSGVINLTEIDDTLKNELREILSTIEHLSVGINSGVYDFQIFFRMSGSYFLSIFRKLHPYILDCQKSQPSRYIEFESICKKIEIERKKRNLKIDISNKGNIKYS